MAQHDRSEECVPLDEDLIELEYDLGQRSVRFTLDDASYPRPAIYGAAYIFIDRCYVYLARPNEQSVRVQLKAKAAEPKREELEELAGEFANELLNQLVRAQVGEATGEIRKYYMARAFFGLTGNPNIDALLMELEQEELDEDELEIAVPWEESRERSKGDQSGSLDE